VFSKWCTVLKKDEERQFSSLQKCFKGSCVNWALVSHVANFGSFQRIGRSTVREKKKFYYCRQTSALVKYCKQQYCCASPLNPRLKRLPKKKWTIIIQPFVYHFYQLIITGTSRKELVEVWRLLWSLYSLTVFGRNLLNKFEKNKLPTNEPFWLTIKL